MIHFLTLPDAMVWITDNATGLVTVLVKDQPVTPCAYPVWLCDEVAN